MRAWVAAVALLMAAGAEGKTMKKQPTVPGGYRFGMTKEEPKKDPRSSSRA